MENNSTLEMFFQLRNMNAELFRLVGATFDSKVDSLRRLRKKNLIVLKGLQKKKLFLMAMLEENETKKSIWKLKRPATFWELNCQCNDDQFFMMHFRMTRRSFDVLCGLLSNFSKDDTNWRKAIAFEKRVAIALFTLSSSCEYRVVSELFGVGKLTVCTILVEFCQDVWQALSSYIKKLPPTQELLNECLDGFQRLGFPQCLGAIDGCHIEVQPNENDATDYYNYKGWYSMVLLALVDYRYRFLYINIGAPGRRNDTQIYNTSLLKKVLENSDVLKSNTKQIGEIQMPVCILGDSAFRFSTNLMKPYPFSLALSVEQKLFNYRSVEEW